MMVLGTQRTLGFDALYFSRIDYQDREKRKDLKTLEVVWRGSKTFGSSADIFTGIFPVNYEPPPGNFYFEINDDSIVIQDDPLLFDYNVEERLNDFVAAAVLQANINRINCAYDDSSIWSEIIRLAKNSSQMLEKPCRILMDLAGPELRTGLLKNGPSIMKISSQIPETSIESEKLLYETCFFYEEVYTTTYCCKILLRMKMRKSLSFDDVSGPSLWFICDFHLLFD